MFGPMSETKRTNLEELGWDPDWEAAFGQVAEEGSFPARVVLEHQHIYRVRTEEGERLGRIAGKLRHEAETREAFPAVGDWVSVRDAPVGDEVVIDAVLPRRSRFLRKAAGKTHEPQVLAANVDTVFLVSGLDHDFNQRRIERYLVTAMDSGARPVIVLNKADLWEEEGVDDWLELAREAAPGVPIHAVSGATSEGLEALSAYVEPGKTLAFVGSSGVGKSTLINRLAGRDVQEVGEVREWDSRGRHTTRHRELIVLPGGALLVDTPGMRSLQLWESEGGLDDAFLDIQELAQGCRFADCAHGDEPGCAVREALDRDELAADRFESYQRLRRELEARAAGVGERYLDSRRPRRGKPPRRKK